MVNILGANSVSGGYEIDNSLRFNDNDSADLRRTPSSAGNRKTFTFSTWLKRANLSPSGNQMIFLAYGANANTGWQGLAFVNDQLCLTGWTYNHFLTTGLFRDPSAWYHIVLAIDTTNGTANDRIKLYVNGTQITDFSQRNNPSQNDDFAVNNTAPHTIGSQSSYNSSSYLDAYLTEVHLVDGAAKAPTDFAETDDNGVWIPKAYTGSYGTNGFYLEFKETGTSQNSSGIGADTSGNDHHWAVTNLAATDVMIDTPTNNFATMNPLLTDTTTVAFSEGNLKTVCTNASTAGSSIAVQKGKWYVEMICTAKTASNAMIGISTVDGFDGQRQLDESQNGGSGHGYVMNATKLPGGASYGATWAVDDIMAIALDLDTAQNTVTFYKNNASQGTIDIDNALYVFAQSNGQGSSTVTYNTNFGADDTFAGEISSAGNTDANGEGLFKYAPPSGYFALNTKNLAEFG